MFGLCTLNPEYKFQINISKSLPLRALLSNNWKMCPNTTQGWLFSFYNFFLWFTCWDMNDWTNMRSLFFNMHYHSQNFRYFCAFYSSDDDDGDMAEQKPQNLFWYFHCCSFEICFNKKHWPKIDVNWDAMIISYKYGCDRPTKPNASYFTSV